MRALVHLLAQMLLLHALPAGLRPWAIFVVGWLTGIAGTVAAYAMVSRGLLNF